MSQKDDLLADYICTENFTHVLNKSTEDLFDLLRSMPQEPEETKSESALESLVVIQFKPPVEMHSLRRLEHLPWVIKFTARGTLHNKRIFSHQFEIEGDVLVSALSMRVRDLQAEMHKIGI